MDNLDFHRTLINLALKEVGVREDKVNNTGSRIREYQSATWLAPGSWPWCAALQCFLLREALKKYPVYCGNSEKFRCKDARAFGWITWAKNKNLELVSSVKPGDIVVFSFNNQGHIGIVVKSLGDTSFKTVEGNTGPDGGREGDGVYLKTRTYANVKAIIRLPKVD